MPNVNTMAVVATHSVCFFYGTNLTELREVCHIWRMAVDHHLTYGTMTCLTQEEADAVMQKTAIACQLPYLSTHTTTTLTRNSTKVQFPSCPTIRHGCLEAMSRKMTHILDKNTMAPKTNVGALDTMATMEKVTQSRLGRFHHTGTINNAMHSASLDGLMGSQQSQKGTHCMYIFCKKGLMPNLQHVLRASKGLFTETRLDTFVDKHLPPQAIHNKHDLPKIIQAVLLPRCPFVVISLRLCSKALFEHGMRPDVLCKIVMSQKPTIYALAYYDDLKCRWHVILQYVVQFCDYANSGGCGKGKHMSICGSTSTVQAWRGSVTITADGKLLMAEAFEKSVFDLLQQYLLRLTTYAALTSSDDAHLDTAKRWLTATKDPNEHSRAEVLGGMRGIISASIPSTCDTPSMLVDTLLHHHFPGLVVGYAIYRHILPTILKTHTGGNEGITNTVICWNPQCREHVIQTSGSNFVRLVELTLLTKQLSFVDIYRCRSTSVPDVLNVLGIEAVHCMHSSASVAGVNHSCIESIVDHILREGKVTLKGNNTVLNEITVENPQKHLVNAAINSTTDTLRGISAGILSGTPVHTGTHGHSLILNTALLQEHE